MKKQITKSQAKKANATQLVVLLIIGIVVLVISGVLLLFETAELIYGIALFGLLFGICFIIAGPLSWYNQNKSIKHSFCPCCETKFDYNTDIEWIETERIDEDRVVTSVVEFTCTCPKCKEEHVFNEKFVVARYNEKKGAWENRNLKQLVKKYFVK